MAEFWIFQNKDSLNRNISENRPHLFQHMLDICKRLAAYQKRWNSFLSLQRHLRIVCNADTPNRRRFLSKSLEIQQKDVIAVNHFDAGIVWITSTWRNNIPQRTVSLHALPRFSSLAGPLGCWRPSCSRSWRCISNSLQCFSLKPEEKCSHVAQEQAFRWGLEVIADMCKTHFKCSKAEKYLCKCYFCNLSCWPSQIHKQNL